MGSSLIVVVIEGDPGCERKMGMEKGILWTGMEHLRAERSVN